MTYITRIANKRIFAKYFLYSLQINYLHWKLSASRSIFSCYATISWKMGKRLGVKWLNVCTVKGKFRSIAHSPEEKELTEGDPLLRARARDY